MNQVIENIKKRRSIRKYKDKKISSKIIKDIIEAGRYAPSSHNSQPWRFVVIINKKRIKELSLEIKGWFKKRLMIGSAFSLFNKKIKKELEKAKKRALAEQDLFLYGAPSVIIIHAKKGRFTVQDCSCAAENMFLAARSLGIGSCWIGFADMALNGNKGLMGRLGIPKGNTIIATLVFGYTSNFPKPHPRKQEADVVKWIK